VPTIRPLLAAAALGLAVAACASKPESKDDMLVAAGFTPIPMKTQAQVASFARLPAHRLSPATYKGRQVWVYPDPTACGCLYNGGQAAYNSYIRTATRQMIHQAVKANQDYEPFNPTAEIGGLDADPMIDPEAYGGYVW
jgi:hypothetical protein